MENEMLLKEVTRLLVFHKQKGDPLVKDTVSVFMFDNLLRDVSDFYESVLRFVSEPSFSFDLRLGFDEGFLSSVWKLEWQNLDEFVTLNGVFERTTVANEAIALEIPVYLPNPHDPFQIPNSDPFFSSDPFLNSDPILSSDPFLSSGSLHLHSEPKCPISNIFPRDPFLIEYKPFLAPYTCTITLNENPNPNPNDCPDTKDPKDIFKLGKPLLYSHKKLYEPNLPLPSLAIAHVPRLCPPPRFCRVQHLQVNIAGPRLTLNVPDEQCNLVATFRISLKALDTRALEARARLMPLVGDCLGDCSEDCSGIEMMVNGGLDALREACGCGLETCKCGGLETCKCGLDAQGEMNTLHEMDEQRDMARIEQWVRGPAVFKKDAVERESEKRHAEQQHEIVENEQQQKVRPNQDQEKESPKPIWSALDTAKSKTLFETSVPNPGSNKKFNARDKVEQFMLLKGIKRNPRQSTMSAPNTLQTPQLSVADISAPQIETRSLFENQNSFIIHQTLLERHFNMKRDMKHYICSTELICDPDFITTMETRLNAVLIQQEMIGKEIITDANTINVLVPLPCLPKAPPSPTIAMLQTMRQSALGHQLLRLAVHFSTIHLILTNLPESLDDVYPFTPPVVRSVTMVLAFMAQVGQRLSCRFSIKMANSSAMAAVIIRHQNDIQDCRPSPRLLYDSRYDATKVERFLCLFPGINMMAAREVASAFESLADMARVGSEGCKRVVGVRSDRIELFMNLFCANYQMTDLTNTKTIASNNNSKKYLKE